MDWARAIEINKEALTRIVAALVALLAAQGGVKRLPLPVYRLIARILHPTESALRRLIVVAARKLVVPMPQIRRMPPGLAIAGKGTGPLAFQLFDTRQHFGDLEDDIGDDSDDNSADEGGQSGGPRIRVVGDPDPRSQFLAKFANPADNNLSSETETARLRRRLETIKRALDHLPREARRMARWRARRAAMAHPKFTTPLRPGPPPGRRKDGRHEIDYVLRECHGLARAVLAEDTS